MSTNPQPETTSHEKAKQTPHPLSGGLGVFLFLVFFAAAGYFAYHNLTTAKVPAPTPLPMVLFCSETQKTFQYAPKEGEQFPVMSEHSKKKTGYPAEECYWKKLPNGKWGTKTEPTYVILNTWLGKPGDTICPDCGRVVVGHNPRPEETATMSSPPTATQAAPATAP